MPSVEHPTFRRSLKRAKAVNNTKAVLTNITKSATANKATTKVPKTVTNNKVSETVKNESTVSASLPSSGTATPDSSASFTAAPCAGGQAALVVSDADDTPSSVAQSIRKRVENSRSSHIVGAVTAPRKMNHIKKGRVPLTAAAKKNHNEFKMPGRECDELLATFAKQKRASRSPSPDTSIWKDTKLFFTGMPVPADASETPVEDEDMIDMFDMPAHVFNRVSSDLEEFTDTLFFHTPTSSVHPSEPTLASTNEVGLDITEDDSVAAALANENETIEESSDDGDSLSIDQTPSEDDSTSGDATSSQGSDEDSNESHQDPTFQTSPEEPLVEESLNFLSWPNKAEYASILSRDEELALIGQHVAPLVLSPNPKKLSCAEKKEAAQAQGVVAASAITIESAPGPHVDETEVDGNTPVIEEQVNPILEELPLACDVPVDTYVDGLLSMPNGCGQDIAARQYEVDLVALHVRPCLELQQPSSLLKKGKKTEKKCTGFAVVKSCDSSVASSSDEDASLQSRPTPRSIASSSSTGSSSSHRSEEDLEREFTIARSTFLGVTSLEDFIVQLAEEGSGKTATKKAVCDAFAHLSAEAFETLTGLCPTFDVDRAATSTIEQRKIKLGKTTLCAFLRGIPFDDEHVAHTRDVVCAFKQAAVVPDKPSEKVMMMLRSASESSS